ncbi:MAG: terpene cyclase/mutase family protein [Planctomycetes bacterium]|nr:terpene cyclase/mutase family protein [Planctomycetota bacterium]
MRHLMVALGFVLLSAPLLAGDFKPTVPLLELKRHEGQWSWMRGDEVVTTHDQGLVRLFYDFAKYQDKDTGWQGLKDGRTTNLLVAHVAQNAPEDKITAMLRRAAQSGLTRVAVAADEIAAPLESDRAPDAAKLPPEYVLIALGDAESDNALRIHLEECTIGLMFSVGRRERQKLIADGSSASTQALIIKPDDTPAEKIRKTGSREMVRQALVKALTIKLSTDAKFDTLQIYGFENDETAAWIWFELAVRACEDINAPRKQRGEDPLKIQWAHTFVEYPDLAETPPGEPSPDDRRGNQNPFPQRVAFEAGERPHQEHLTGALEWLRDHQNREGYWSATTFDEDSTRTSATRTSVIDFTRGNDRISDKGWADTCDVGLTGLALLAFAGAGEDHKAGDYRATIRQGVLYLRKVQDNDGCFGAKEDDHFVYNHAIVTMALAEIYGLSGDQMLKPVVDKAVDFILKAQNPGLGWRYGVQPGVNDSSVTSWMVMALNSARLAGIEFDAAKSYSDAAEWFNLVTVDVDGYPRTGYDSPGSNNARLRNATDYQYNPSMDAAYVTAMLAMGKSDANDKTVRALARACVEDSYLPAWEHLKIDFYYWHYASQACYQVGGATWTTWERAVMPVLKDHQRGWHKADVEAERSTQKILDEHGSWDPVGAWGQAGGRVYSTAMGALILESSYRYARGED